MDIDTVNAIKRIEERLGLLQLDALNVAAFADEIKTRVGGLRERMEGQLEPTEHTWPDSDSQNNQNDS